MQNWLNRSVGNRISFVSVATALSLVLLLGTVAFPLFYYQTWKNFNEHTQNKLDRVGDRFEFRLFAAQQALEQLAKSSFIVNSFVDSSGREIYLSPTLRDFRLPIDVAVNLVLFDANLSPFASNMPDYSASGNSLRLLAEKSYKAGQASITVQENKGHKTLVLAFPVYYPPASSYEGVLVATVDAEEMFHLPENYLEHQECFSVDSIAGPLNSWNCGSGSAASGVSRKLVRDRHFLGEVDLTINYAGESRIFILQLLGVFLVYLLIGVGAVVGAFILSRLASSIFVGQLKSLSEASLALAESPNAHARVTWAHADEIGQFVDAFNRMVDKLQAFQGALETRVSERTNELSIILDNVVDGIITIDERGTVQSFNRAAETIFGYGANDVIGQNVNMLMPEPYHSAHDSYLENYLNTGTARIIGTGREVMGRRRDSSTFPMDLAVSRSINHGKPLFIGLVRDITERKRIDKMKSEFVSTVSHELRTPLTSISGALGLLVGGVLGEMPEQAKKMIGIAHKNSLLLTHLINDLLDMEKLVAGKMIFDFQLQPLMPLIEQTLESIHSYGEQYKVNFKLVAREDVQVRVDAGRLVQVLNNFLSNAAKFSPADGQVDIAVRKISTGVRVEVTDRGSGISSEFRNRIFQKFSQADSSDTRQKGGTGLGLAISKELMECMGGVIGFESEEGKGSCFYFELPVLTSPV